MKYIAVRTEDESRLRGRGFHQKVEGVGRDGRLLVSDLSFSLFMSLDMRPGEISVGKSPIYHYRGTPCLPAQLNF
jgi:hypothetical protein